jgi:dienelactone hydrolase
MLVQLLKSRRSGRGLLLALIVSPYMFHAAAPAAGPVEVAPQVIRLWPGQAPGTQGWSGPEETADVELPNLGRVHIITNVTIPTLTVVRPAAGRANGTAVVIVPGGAFRALPWDLDGLETAAWLARRGITAFILKYRVRPPDADVPADRSFDDFARRTEGARAVAVRDAEQAVRVIRSEAKQFGIGADRIGMIGFSAGAMITAVVADAADPRARPNFAASLYGALLSGSGPSASAAPIFIVAAQDDAEAPPTMSAKMFVRWTDAKRPAELHVYERGGHGFAFRPHQKPSDSWTEAFEEWLAARGYIRAAAR